MLVGVFSIIVVMTAMRAMQKKIESDLNQLGGQTFVVQTWPQLQFEGAGRAGKNIGGANASTSQQGLEAGTPRHPAAERRLGGQRRGRRHR